MQNTRLNVIDALKGFGIVFVVVGHALAGLIDAGFSIQHEWLRSFFAIIYMFHMPLFFFISGIFVSRRLETNPSQFKRNLIQKIIWPYFLWGFIQTIIITFAGRLVNHPVDNLGLSLLSFLFYPPSIFWFLYALFIMHMISIAFGPKVSSPYILIISFVIYFLGTVISLPYILNMTSKMIVYYALGVYFGNRLLEFLNTGKVNKLYFLLIPLMFILSFFSYQYSLNLGVINQWPTEAFKIFKDINGIHNFFAACSIIFTLLLIFTYFNSKMPKILLNIGKCSMPIYIWHVIFIAGVRILILKTFPNLDLILLLIILTFVGILFPFIAFYFSERFKISKWLGF